MTTPQPTAIDPAAAAAENAEVKGILDSTTDNPNPAPLDNPAPDAPKVDAEGETEAKPERWDPRAKIIAARKARLAGQEAEDEPQGTDLIARDAMGNAIPPFLQETAAPEAPAPKTYDLKVNGQDVRIASFDELAKAAGLDPAEAKDLPEATLLKSARIALAAEARLAAAKEQARQSERAPATPADQSDTGETDPSTQPKTKAPAKANAQFAEDPEEAAAELEAYLTESVSQVLEGREAAQVVNAVKTEVATSVRAFESANTDITNDPDMSALFYGRYMIDAVKDALVATGQITREAVDQHVTNTQQALDAYEAVRLGRLQVSDPSSILNAAAEKFRAKFAKPSAAATTSVAPVNPRVEAKRSLTPQPTRAAAPLPVTPAPKQDARYKSAVHQMRVRRGLVPQAA